MGRIIYPTSAQVAMRHGGKQRRLFPIHSFRIVRRRKSRFGGRGLVTTRKNSSKKRLGYAYLGLFVWVEGQFKSLPFWSRFCDHSCTTCGKQPLPLKGHGFCLKPGSGFSLGISLRMSSWRIQRSRQVWLAYKGSPARNITSSVSISHWQRNHI